MASSPVQITVGPAGQALATTPTARRSSFTQKKIEVSIKLAQDTGLSQPNKFAGGNDATTLRDHRTSVRVRNSGTPTKSEATVQIWGLDISTMNQLSTLGMVISAVPRNTISIRAGDDASGMSLVFSGTITQAYFTGDGAPSVPFTFECKSGLAEAVLPAAPQSYKGATDVGTIMSNIAKAAGWGFENSGVNVSIANPYYAGTIGQQWEKLAREAGILAALVAGGDPNTQGGLVLAIWPKTGSRGGQAPTISPTTGMIGYPSYTQQGILVKSVYNPQIGFGGKVAVSGSVLEKANGTWIVHKLDHALDALMLDGGLWESSVYGYGNALYPIATPR